MDQSGSPGGGSTTRAVPCACGSGSDSAASDALDDYGHAGDSAPGDGPGSPGPGNDSASDDDPGTDNPAKGSPGNCQRRNDGRGLNHY
jgi:hypothetical protein